MDPEHPGPLAREPASKRPLDRADPAATPPPEPKRAKTEPGDDEESLESGLALLVQNALSNVGNFVDRFDAEPDGSPPRTTTEALNAEPPPEPARRRPAFSQDPAACVCELNINALGTMVCRTLASGLASRSRRSCCRRCPCCTFFCSSPSTKPWA